MQANLTSQALRQSQAILATNGSFFSPFRDRHIFDYYPQAGDAVQVVGFAFSRGQPLGYAIDDWPVMALDTQGAVHFVETYTDLNQSDLYMAISGRSWLVRDGENVAQAEGLAYPRLAVGVDELGERLYLVAADGKQPGYSDGLDLSDLASELISFGVHQAIELDGGGSVTMAVKEGNAVQVLNRPAHTKIPGRERPVANHLVVYSRGANTERVGVRGRDTGR